MEPAQAVAQLGPAGGYSGYTGVNPLTPAQVLRYHRAILTEFELGEILEYRSVFYAGRRRSDKVRASARLPLNCGFDDERGEYRVVEGDHIAYRFEVVNKLGSGSFGQVLRCLDHQTGVIVAVKLIRNRRRFFKQGQVEVDLLQRVRAHDPSGTACVVHVIDSFVFRHHLCIVFPLLSVDLYTLIKMHNFRGFSVSTIRKFAIQVLQSLRLFDRMRVVHCDLKPENILLLKQGRSAIKVIDLGSGCDEDKRMYSYIQSRFYRAPEVIMGLPYGRPIDMWSFGCILAELYTGYPLFPGENERQQLLCIMEVTGVAPPSMISESPRRKAFFEASGVPIVKADSKGRTRLPGTKTLARALRTSDKQFLSFLEGCIRIDPRTRMRPAEAQEHPWVVEGFRELEGSSSSAMHGIRHGYCPERAHARAIAATNPGAPAHASASEGTAAGSGGTGHHGHAPPSMPHRGEAAGGGARGRSAHVSNGASGHKHPHHHTSAAASAAAGGSGGGGDPGGGAGAGSAADGPASVPSALLAPPVVGEGAAADARSPQRWNRGRHVRVAQRPAQGRSAATVGATRPADGSSGDANEDEGGSASSSSASTARVIAAEGVARARRFGTGPPISVVADTGGSSADLGSPHMSPAGSTRLRNASFATAADSIAYQSVGGAPRESMDIGDPSGRMLRMSGVSAVDAGSDAASQRESADGGAVREVTGLTAVPDT